MKLILYIIAYTYCIVSSYIYIINDNLQGWFNMLVVSFILGATYVNEKKLKNK